MPGFFHPNLQVPRATNGTSSSEAPLPTREALGLPLEGRGLEWWSSRAGKLGFRPCLVGLRPGAGVVVGVLRLTALFGIFPFSLASRYIRFHFFFPLPLSQRAEALIFSVVDNVKPERVPGERV